MVVLLMKRWGITLNPAYASSEADNVFQQTKSTGTALQRESFRSCLSHGRPVNVAKCGLLLPC